MEATMTPVGEMSADQLGAWARGDDGALEVKALKELQRRAKDGEEDAVEVLAALDEDEAARSPEDEQAAADAGEAWTTDDLKAEREAQGLDGETALPKAADDDGSAVDISGGIELQIEGLESPAKISFAGVGGKKPDESWLRVVGGAFMVPKQFEKGEDLFVELKLRVGGIAFDDKTDPKTAQATGCKRTHKGRVLGAVLIPRSSREQLELLQHAVRDLLETGSQEAQDRCSALLEPIE